MKTVLHKANTRGHAHHGWLDAHHTFSFASYQNEERMNFGVLRVLNDDVIANGQGFDTHPHENMEIITIPLTGDLEHKDSMGNSGIISAGEIQAMSAGTGIAHSEFNKNQDRELGLLQIWVLPNQLHVTPRYDQTKLDLESYADEFVQILSPNPVDEGVWIHQQAWFHIGQFNSQSKQSYRLKDDKNGLYIFIVEGSATLSNQILEKRDGYGIWDTAEVGLTIAAHSKVLLLEVPMHKLA